MRSTENGVLTRVTYGLMTASSSTRCHHRHRHRVVRRRSASRVVGLGNGYLQRLPEV